MENRIPAKIFKYKSNSIRTHAHLLSSKQFSYKRSNGIHARMSLNLFSSILKVNAQAISQSMEIDGMLAFQSYGIYENRHFVNGTNAWCSSNRRTQRTMSMDGKMIQMNNLNSTLPRYILFLQFLHWSDLNRRQKVYASRAVSVSYEKYTNITLAKWHCEKHQMELYEFFRKHINGKSYSLWLMPYTPNIDAEYMWTYIICLS